MTSPNESASKRQTWAIRCASGLDVRSLDLSRLDASTYLERLNGDEKQAAVAELASRLDVSAPEQKPARPNHAELFERAHKAAQEAGKLHKPVPMVVQQHANPLDDSSPVVAEYAPIESGICGFAWVNVSPGTSSFARWLMKQVIVNSQLTSSKSGPMKDWPEYWVHTGYRGGVDININGFGQSYERKHAAAGAMAAVLSEAGITAYPMGRID